MDRPILKIKRTIFDFFLEVIGGLSLLLLLLLPLMYYSELPDIIPVHFNFEGTVDKVEGRSQIWSAPIIGILLYVFIFWLSKRPHMFNYIQPVTEENAKYLYTTAARMIRVLNTAMIVLFVYITYASIQTALDQQQGLNVYLVPMLMVLFFSTTIYFVFKLGDKRKLDA